MANVIYVTDNNVNRQSSLSTNSTSSGEDGKYCDQLSTKIYRTLKRGTKLRTKKDIIVAPKELKLVEVNNGKNDTGNKNNNPQLVLTKAKTIYKKSAPNDSYSTQFYSSKKKEKKPDSCPTRIIELAAPSKRHCMATWRQRADKLPPDMVQRLKMYVNDEIPVVNVSDAIDSFQRKKKVKRVKRQEYKCLNVDLQTKKMCVKFSNRIARRLMNPTKCILKDEWERISEEVNVEIAKLMKTCVKLSNYNRKMNEEISNRVTVWMADILVEAENLLLEQDLRDLDDHEGPLLDFIEDLLDEALEEACKIIMAKYPERVSEVEVLNSTEASLILENNVFSNVINDSLQESDDNSPLSDTIKQNDVDEMNDVENDITNFIEGLTDNDNIKIDNTNENDTNEVDNTNEVPEINDTQLSQETLESKESTEPLVEPTSENPNNAEVE